MTSHVVKINGKVFAASICTRAKGSWKWQDAFEIVLYSPKRLKNGKLVWSSRITLGKMSMPQIRRRFEHDASLSGATFGSLHNHEITAEELQAIALIAGGAA